MNPAPPPPSSPEPEPRPWTPEEWRVLIEATPPEAYVEADRALLALAYAGQGVEKVIRQIVSGAWTAMPGDATASAAALQGFACLVLEVALITDRVRGVDTQQISRLAALGGMGTDIAAERMQSLHRAWQVAWHRVQKNLGDWCPSDADPHAGPPRLPGGADHPGVTAAALLRAFPEVPPALRRLEAYTPPNGRCSGRVPIPAGSVAGP